MMEATGKKANFAIVLENNVVMDKFKKYGNVGSFLLVMTVLVKVLLAFLERHIFFSLSQFFMSQWHDGSYINVLNYCLNLLLQVFGYILLLCAAMNGKALPFASRSFLIVACASFLLNFIGGIFYLFANIQIVTVIISTISILNLLIIICFVVFALTSDMKRQFKILVAVFGAVYVLESFIPYLLAESTQPVLNFWLGFVKIINFMFYFSLWLGFATYPVDKRVN